MRTGPLVDALIEQLVGDLGRYALKNGFHVVVEGAVLARVDPWTRCGLQLGDRRGGQAGSPGAGGRAARAGDHRGSATAPCLPSATSAGRPNGPAWHTARGMMGME
ncbi:hypothetical protein DXZ75_10625 [Streptomyces sp. AcE210]|nr:hypothetical protein DXZ75_10625 [Streptomyces sp. AcE210]